MGNHANFITCRHQTFHLGRGVTWLSAQRQSTCKCTLPTGDTNFDLKSGVFVPIAGILELVNRTLVNGVPLLTWRRKRGRWKEKKKEWREAGKKRGVKDRLKVYSTEQKRPESTVTDLVTILLYFYAHHFSTDCFLFFIFNMLCTGEHFYSRFTFCFNSGLLLISRNMGFVTCQYDIFTITTFKNLFILLKFSLNYTWYKKTRLPSKN